MNLFRWWRAAAELFAGLARRLRRAPKIYQVRSVEELPDRLRSTVLYIVAEDSLPMHASMACPRGKCRDVLNMNLLPDDHPVWTLNVTADGRPSLRPSVWRKPGCGCHFWMRDGRVHWC
jgi:Family of unknown function (DUF6527)